MGVTSTTFDYKVGDLTCEGYLARPDGPPRPVVLISHAWAGQSDYERGKADRIAAELGYAAFAIDLYGKGNRGSSVEENTALMQPLLDDRSLLHERLQGAVDQSRMLDEVDTSRRAAAGFCFGGLCVLDMARTGMDVAGVASFHGLFGAPAVGKVDRITAKIIAFHGWDDPMAKPDDAMGLARELSAAGADWQLHAYGGVMHAFTTPGANNPDFGTVYDADADRRSWQVFRDFLAETIG